MSEIKLSGRIILRCEIEALTGLHIGGMGGDLEIGGVDNPVIRNPLTQEPFIPGSSLRGKMRSQLEKKIGSPQNQSVGKATIHVCKGEAALHPCHVCRLFGMPASDQGGTSTRLLIRDCSLTQRSRAELEAAHTDQAFTEVKAEVAIDRVTSAAAPRNLERVPAGAIFGPAEMVFSLYQESDMELFSDLRDCLQLTEDDYLGGGGSRGNGKIRFINIQVTLRTASEYSKEVDLGTFANLKEFEKGYEKLVKQAAELLKSGRS